LESKHKRSSPSSTSSSSSSFLLTHSKNTNISNNYSQPSVLFPEKEKEEGEQQQQQQLQQQNNIPTTKSSNSFDIQIKIHEHIPKKRQKPTHLHLHTNHPYDITTGNNKKHSSSPLTLKTHSPIEYIKQSNSNSHSNSQSQSHNSATKLLQHILDSDSEEEQDYNHNYYRSQYIGYDNKSHSSNSSANSCGSITSPMIYDQEYIAKQQKQKQVEDEEDLSLEDESSIDIVSAIIINNNNNNKVTSPTSSTDRNKMQVGRNSGISISSPTTSISSLSPLAATMNSTNTSTSTFASIKHCFYQFLVIKCIYNNPILKFVLYIPTIADSIQSSSTSSSSSTTSKNRSSDGATTSTFVDLTSSLLENSKMTFFGLLVACLILDGIFILPSYCISFIITEYGVYALILFNILRLGRFILRLIAFPGSTYRVQGDIENEFSKYSVKMIQNGINCVIEFCKLILSLEEPSMYNISSSSSTNSRNCPSGSSFSESESERIIASVISNTSTIYSVYDVIPLWKKVEQYRDRVFGLYFDVISCLHLDPDTDQSSSSSSSPSSSSSSPTKTTSTMERTRSSHDLHDPTITLSSLTTKYQNNKLCGSDVGNLISSTTKSARKNGLEFFHVLKRVLADLDHLEQSASDILNNTTTTNNNNNSNMKSPIKKNTKITLETYRAAQKLFISITELNDLLPNLALKSMNYSNKNDPSESNHDDDDSCDGGGGSSTGARASTRKSMLSQGNTIIAGIQSAIASIVSLFDAPPHESIFGLDVLRGTMLSRYVGAKQYWFPRPKSEGGGMIDVLHIPSYSRMLDSEGTLSNTDYNGQCKQKIEKAVLFCNPNAGLVEVATGISLIGGNVANNGRVSNMACWSDFYVENGFDIFLFNYAGFGRSYAGKNGGSSCVGPATKERSMNAFCVLGRIVYNSFFGFKPTPSSLKADAFAVANHMITQFDVGDMVIHGESIGGMAAASAGRKLSAIEHFNTATSVPKSYPTLLLCDRTFCNLDSVAERLVGSWTSAVIPLLTPFWNTDVAGDFIAATCKKVIAQDAADSIIHFAASLKKGVATAKELNKGSTKGVGKFLDRPLHYRMSDWENVGVLESKFVNVKISLRQIQAPIWPADKYFDLREAFHFAACARRIGKVATTIRKEMLWNSNNQLLSKFEDEEEGIEITAVFSRDTSPDEDTLSCQTDEKNNVILEVWETLARCDGLTGLPLGAAVKEGDDCVIDWLSCLTIFGSQRVAKEAEKRMDGKTDVVIQSVDFDVSVSQRDDDEEETRLVPLPLPGVITLLTQLYQDKEIIKDIEKELEYCIQMLEYILSRITAKTYVTRNLDITHFRETFEGVATGRYLNLNCGHNNQYSAEERLQLCAILTEACDSENFFA